MNSSDPISTNPHANFEQYAVTRAIAPVSLVVHNYDEAQDFLP